MRPPPIGQAGIERPWNAPASYFAEEQWKSKLRGRVVALMTAINQAVFAFAPAILGALRDLEGGYVLAFGLAACTQVAAALVVIARRGSFAAK
jgi:hypothetical protein